MLTYCSSLLWDVVVSTTKVQLGWILRNNKTSLNTLSLTHTSQDACAHGNQDLCMLQRQLMIHKLPVEVLMLDSSVFCTQYTVKENTYKESNGESNTFRALETSTAAVFLFAQELLLQQATSLVMNEFLANLYIANLTPEEWLLVKEIMCHWSYMVSHGLYTER
ncbi:hypothetical protein PROFUN_04845 [Planoprotostelium fungivorum]|uniref:Uncharacterized protein n=1 Tax=Planoprotostelium fungivorum TaxID=1890364 RepID=A0A2P6NEZ7_9EUKA|nr:hypothetical protein PROFUN_04845 [Planoprotostelium fungivorum]